MRKIRLPKLKISIPFFCLVVLVYIMDFRNVFLPTLAAVSIHELSHIVAIRVCGGTIDKIDIRAFGVRVNVPELRYMSYKREIIIAAAGPFMGIITAILFSATASLLKTKSFDYFIGVNIVITAINMIPVYPLDGGRILLSGLLIIFSVRVAYVISYVLTIISIAALFSLCAFLASKGALNPSLVIFSLYITSCGVQFRPLL